MTLSKNTLFLFLSYLVTIILLMIFQSADAMYILVPAVSAVWIGLYCLVSVWRRDGETTVFDAGLLCVLFTTLYSVIPLVNFYFGGLKFGPLSDTRLQSYDPSAEELGMFFLNHVVYLSSLVSGYLMFRKSNRSLDKANASTVNFKAITIIICVSLALFLYFGLLLYSGIGFRTSYGDESHIALGPLWLQQVNGKLLDVQLIFNSAVLAFLVLKKSNFWARSFLYILIIYQIGLAFLYPGSRGEVATLVVLTILFWHAFYGERGITTTAIYVLVSFVAFMFLGLYRSFPSIGEMLASMENLKVAASATNEFQSILGTGFDVNKMLESGIDVPDILAFNDFIPLLPPQQLLPFSKLTASEWYLIQIFQDGTGVGFMWSVIAQSLVGFGIFELVARGLLLGWFLALAHRWYQRRFRKFLPTVLYANLCLATLWTFRDTTGAILWTIIWQLIPFYALFYMFGLRFEFSSSLADITAEKGETFGRSG